jgi:hypothetical protein
MANSREEYREKHLKNLSTFLNRWNGGDAKLWEYRAAHSSITIRITSKNKPGNLHISCLGPEYIQGPVFWEHCNFEVIDNICLKDGETGYLVIDKGAGFFVRAEQVEVAENCKPFEQVVSMSLSATGSLPASGTPSIHSSTVIEDC